MFVWFREINYLLSFIAHTLNIKLLKRFTIGLIISSLPPLPGQLRSTGMGLRKFDFSYGRVGIDLDLP